MKNSFYFLIFIISAISCSKSDDLSLKSVNSKLNSESVNSLSSRSNSASCPMKFRLNISKLNTCPEEFRWNLSFGSPFSSFGNKIVNPNPIGFQLNTWINVNLDMNVFNNFVFNIFTVKVGNSPEKIYTSCITLEIAHQSVTDMSPYCATFPNQYRVFHKQYGDSNFCCTETPNFAPAWSESFSLDNLCNFSTPSTCSDGVTCYYQACGNQ